MNLLRDPWILWRRRSGQIVTGPLTDLITELGKDPVIGVAWPRADFDGACLEFLIGMTTLAFQPEDEEEWEALFHEPPDETAFAEALARLPGAFDLEGDGKRFLQDASATDMSEGARKPIEQLLIGSAGDQSVKFNADLFVRRGGVVRLGRPAAAMALITVQTYSPAAGSGFRTSLRGGGPLTTLADPRRDHGGIRASEQPLWQKIWANVETKEQWRRRGPQNPGTIERALPWMHPTRVSSKEGAGEIGPQHAHPLEAYFGMPRRVRLEFDGPGRCDLTGMQDDVTTSFFLSRPHGAQYNGWQHPLSPYYQPKPDQPYISVHGQPGGVGWRDWQSLTLAGPEAGVLRKPAQAISTFAGRARRLRLRTYQMHAFGFNVDKAKVRGWINSSMPAFAELDADAQARLIRTASALVNATDVAAGALVGAIKEALFDRPKDARGDYSPVRWALWGSTEQPFYEALERVVDVESDEAADQHVARWLGVLTERTLAEFDVRVSSERSNKDGLAREVAARYGLSGTLLGYGKAGAKLWASLGLEPPREPKKTANRSHSEATT